jgi:hypothetical protein
MVPVVTASGQTLSKGQAIMRVTALIDGQSEEGYMGGADSLRLEQPKVPYSFSLVQGDENQTSSFRSQYTNFLSYSSSPMALIAPVDFSWEPTPRLPRMMSSPVDFQNYLEANKARPIPAQNQTGGFRETGIRNVPRWHSDIRIYGTYSRTNQVVANVTIGNSILPAPANRTIDNTPWIPIRFDYPASMRGVTGATFSGGGSLTPGFYSSVTVPAGQTLVLERGASYGIEALTLEKNGNIVLDGASTEPCLVYYKYFQADNNSLDWDLVNRLGCRINMPTNGSAPVPWDLHFLGVKGAMTSIWNSQVAAVVIADGQFWSDNSEHCGTVIGRSVHGDLMRSNFHFDEAMRGRETPVEPSWILVSQAKNG